MIHRDVRRRRVIQAQPQPPEPEPPVVRERVVARCIVGGCDWMIPVTAGRAALPEIEKHRVEEHPWVKPGRLHRIELEADA